MKAEPTNQKLRGGYYTPKPISDFIAEWAIRSKTAKVLEPSCGDGNIIESAISVFRGLGLKNNKVVSNITGIEYDKDEVEIAIQRLNNQGITDTSSLIYQGDFFEYCNKFLNEGIFFDVIIGNPPFIRYQNFIEEHRVTAFEIMKRAGLKTNRLTNSWVPFLIASALLLTKNGRLGMVIPAELFQVSYAAETRQFLSDYFSEITIVTFRKLVFADIQQEVVLLLCEKNGDNNSGIKVVELDGVEDLLTFKHEDIASIELKPMDHTNEKWSQYYLTTEEILLLRKLRENPKITISKDALDVDVGVVTGQNDFFVLNEKQVVERKLDSNIKRIVTRSAHLEGAILTEKDWISNVVKQYPTSLFTPPDLPFEQQSNEIKLYILYGENLNINKGYKCGIRKKWYIVPSVRIPDGFMLRQVHSYPKIIINEAMATCTDTIHRVRFKDGYNGKQVAAAFVNSLTLAFSEVVGRSYGGGVLTFEPSESENLPLPLLYSEKLNIEQIDNLLRENDIEAVLNITDNILLIDGLGLSLTETVMLRNIWKKLRDRRINRKRSKV